MDALEKALKDRDDFLKANPKYKEFQKEIDYIMNQVGDDPNARVEALLQLIEGKKIEQQVALKELLRVAKKHKFNLEQIKREKKE